MEGILIGADPEVFYREEGNLVSAYGMIEGDKLNPQPVKDGAVQVDGMALEFNIDPAESSAQWVANIQSVMAQLADMVPGTLDPSPVAEFGAEYIAEQPLEATDLGCDPDFNAWTGEENEKPDVDLPFRTGAGHVHVGFTNGAGEGDPAHIEACRMITKQLDFRLGLVSLVLDTCTKRRQMYGQAGAFRPKPYGVEYRVLSNFWLQSEDYMVWVFDTVHSALTSLKEHGPLEDRYGDIQEIINNSDEVAARLIISTEGWEIPNV
tara:strand:+ start:7507 stop:8298 length:792 start_codon:yes stop_codon:yes gene_type:complete